MGAREPRLRRETEFASICSQELDPRRSPELALTWGYSYTTSRDVSEESSTDSAPTHPTPSLSKQGDWVTGVSPGAAHWQPDNQCTGDPAGVISEGDGHRRSCR